VLNVSYCDEYVTAEPKQLEYASLLLSRHTRVSIYTNEAPVDDWLLDLIAHDYERSEDSNNQHREDESSVAAN
jgi:hypothetical protein